MNGAEITISIFIVSILQFLLLPFQVINYFARKTDQTRLRFLTLAAVYFGFNLGLISFIASTPYRDFELTAFRFLIEIGVISYTIYYVLKELGISITKFYQKIVIFALVLFSYEVIPFLPFGSVVINILNFGVLIVVEFTVSLFIWAIVKELRKKNYFNSPITSGILVVSGITFLIPLLLFVTDSLSLYFLLVNLVFFVLAYIYLRQFFMEMKTENRLVSNFNKPNLPNLLDRFEYNQDDLNKLDLTIREEEISKFILLGHSYKEIASLLVITPSSVRKHASNIFGKVGVDSLQEYREKFSKDN